MSLADEFLKPSEQREAAFVGAVTKKRDGSLVEWYHCPTCGRLKPTNVIEKTTVKQRADNSAAAWACDADFNEWRMKPVLFTDSGPQAGDGNISVQSSGLLEFDRSTILVFGNAQGDPIEGQKTKTFSIISRGKITELKVESPISKSTISGKNITLTDITGSGDVIVSAKVDGTASQRVVTVVVDADQSGNEVEETKRFTATPTTRTWVDVVSGDINTDAAGAVYTCYVEDGTWIITPLQASGPKRKSAGLWVSGVENNMAVGDHVQFNTTRASVIGSNITLDTTSPYSTGTNVASTGRFTLKAGSAYMLRGFQRDLGTVQWIGFAWFNTDTNTQIGQWGGSGAGSAIDANVADSLAIGMIDCTVDTRVELRRTGESSTSPLYWGNTNLSGTYAEIQEVG
jgi:hypothetical protein